MRESSRQAQRSASWPWRAARDSRVRRSRTVARRDRWSDDRTRRQIPNPAKQLARSTTPAADAHLAGHVHEVVQAAARAFHQLGHRARLASFSTWRSKGGSSSASRRRSHRDIGPAKVWGQHQPPLRCRPVLAGDRCRQRRPGLGEGLAPARHGQVSELSRSPLGAAERLRWPRKRDGGTLRRDRWHTRRGSRTLSPAEHERSFRVQLDALGGPADQAGGRLPFDRRSAAARIDQLCTT